MFFCICVQSDDLVPPAGLTDQMFYSTVSSLDRKPSMSSDEEGDIYGHTVTADALNCPSSQTEKKTGRDQDIQDRDTLKPEQVRDTNLIR